MIIGLHYFVLKYVLCLEMESFPCHTFANSKHYGDKTYVLGVPYHAQPKNDLIHLP